MSNIYELNDVCKTFEGGYNAFNYLNLDIPKAVTTAIVGEQWSGKSTISAMLAGVESYVGSIKYKDIEISTIKLKEARIGFIPEKLALCKRKSARYNLTLPLKLRGASTTELNTLISNANDHIAFDLDAKVKKLSAFEQAQIVLLRLFSIHRDVFIIDGLFDRYNRYSETEQLALITLYEALKPNDASVIITTDSVEVVHKLNITNVAMLAYNSVTDYGDLTAISTRPNTLASYKILHPEYKAIEAEVSNSLLNIDGVNYNNQLNFDDKIFKKVIIMYIDNEMIADKVIDMDKISNNNALIYDVGSERLISLDINKETPVL